MELEKYIEKFNEIFGTEIKSKDLNNKIKILETIFKGLEDKLYSTTNEYEEIRRKYIENSDKLIATLKTEQKKLFDESWELHNSMNAQIELQLFVFGYLIASELNKDCLQSST